VDFLPPIGGEREKEGGGGKGKKGSPLCLSSAKKGGEGKGLVTSGLVYPREGRRRGQKKREKRGEEKKP